MGAALLFKFSCALLAPIIVVLAASAVATLEAQLDHLEQFRPGKPTPTHRFEGVTA